MRVNNFSSFFKKTKKKEEEGEREKDETREGVGLSRVDEGEIPQLENNFSRKNGRMYKSA